MIRWVVLCLFSCTLPLLSFSQEKPGYFANKKWWKKVKKENPQYKKVFQHSDKYRFEVIYGQVGADKKVRYYQTGSPDVYYYPASLVKFPVAVKLLEWLSFENVDNLRDLHLRTIEKTACGFPIGDTVRHYYGTTRQTMHPVDLSMLLSSFYRKKNTYDSLFVLADSIQANTVIKLSKEPGPVHLYDVLNEMLVQSDNANFNQVFEAVAGKNSNLDDLFYIPRPFIPCKDDYSSAGADFYLYDEKWKSLPGGNVQKKHNAHMKNEKVGIAQITGENDTLKIGRDFSKHNHVSLSNITKLMQEVVYSGSTGISLSLSKQNRLHLLYMLSSNPAYSIVATKPEYLQAAFNKTNFLFPATDSAALNTGGRYYNIIGQAYGFTSDVLYYCNPGQNIEFFLAVRIYTNEDEVLNDDKYEYEEIAFPLMRDVFNYVYTMEKGRKKSTSNELLCFPEQR